jgi:glucose-6-phosphate 1-dehydrogenase
VTAICLERLGSGCSFGIIKLSSEEEGWSRTVVEKPFGRDLKSACALNNLIADFVDKNHIYRICHYLGNETILPNFWQWKTWRNRLIQNRAGRLS